MAAARGRAGAVQPCFAAPACFAAGAVCAAAAATRLQRSAFAGCALGTPTPGRVGATRRARSAYVMQLSAPKIGRPKTSIKKSVGTSSTSREPQTETGKGAAKARPRRKTQADEIPMYKVILLGDEEYEEGHVVTQLQKTIRLDKQKALNVFHEAQETGSSVACVTCEEHAEFYAQQLRRQEIFVAVEKDE